MSRIEELEKKIKELEKTNERIAARVGVGIGKAEN